MITNLRKEEVSNKRRSLTKLKLDLTKPTVNNVEKIINYLAKDLKDFDTNSMLEYLKFTNYDMKISKVSNSLIAGKVRRNFTKNNEEVLELTIPTKDNENIIIYTIPEVKIPAKTRKYMYYIPTFNEQSKILDISFIYGLLKLTDIVYKEVSSNKDFYFNEEFKNISLFANSYTEEELKELVDIPVNTKMSLMCLRGMDHKLYSGALRLIIDATMVMQTIDSNIELTNKYNAEASSDCARAYETKKNIPEKVLNVMENTKFLEDFKYVEIDEDTDLSKFHEIEKEWSKVKVALNLDKYLGNEMPELRFKKLGKHRALGLYYPSIKCICVDTISPSSFIHEVAHFIDYTAGEGQLSLENNFFEIISEYKKAYLKYVNENKEVDSNVKYLIRKESYFFTPTEIFARCMEMYLVDKGVKTSFLKIKDDLKMSSGYVPLTDRFKCRIEKYFDELLTLNLEVLEKEEPKIKEILNTKNKSVKYVAPVSDPSGQFQFAI